MNIETFLQNIADKKYGLSTDRPHDKDARKQFFVDMKKAFNVDENNPKVTKAAALAWKYGNSHSYEEVVVFFEDLVDLIS